MLFGSRLTEQCFVNPAVAKWTITARMRVLLYKPNGILLLQLSFIAGSKQLIRFSFRCQIKLEITRMLRNYYSSQK